MVPGEIDDDETVDADASPARAASTDDLAPPETEPVRRATVTAVGALPAGAGPLPFADDVAAGDKQARFQRTLASTTSRPVAPATPPVALPPPTTTVPLTSFAARFFPVAAPSRPAIPAGETLPILSLDADRATALPATTPLSHEPSTPRLVDAGAPSPAAVPFAPPPAPSPASPLRPRDAAREPSPTPILVSLDASPVPSSPVDFDAQAVATLCALADAASPRFDQTLALAGASLGDFTRSLEARLAHIDAALLRGDDGPLAAFDAAYLTALEDAVAPVDVARYAALVVAHERGRPLDLLAEWGFPSAAFTRILRVWQARAFADDDLAARVDEAIDDARR